MEETMSKFSRRSFLIGSILGSAAVALTRPLHASAQAGALPTGFAGFDHGLFPQRPDLLTSGHGDDYGQLLRRVLAALGESGIVARPGETVLIKPTLAYNRQPGQGGNVHPDVLRAVIEVALDAGAKKVIVFDRTGLRAADAYRVSGAWLAIHRLADARVRLVELQTEDFVAFDPVALGAASGLPQGYAQAELTGGLFEQTGIMDALAQYRVCRYVLEADRIINLASARVHPSRRVALGMANLLGLIGGGPADVSWRQRQDAELAVLTAAIRPDLTILDATRAVVRNGPMGRGLPDIERWDRLAASRDPLAVEVYGAGLFGVPAEELPSVALAAQLGAGSPVLTRARLLEL
jgi:uncharacterized protein (DUF362 family)